MKKTFLGLVTSIALMLLFTSNVSNISQSVFAEQAIQELSAKDFEEIKELYARYNQGSDFRDTELFLSAFAEDAVMTREGGDIIGMDELRADRARRYEGKTGDVGRRHINGSYLITPTSDGAEARTYYLLMDVTVRPPNVISSGYYEDKFGRTNSGWKIKHRTLYRDTLDH